MSYSFGWLPDPPDKRDFRFAALVNQVVPVFIDLRKYCSPIRDQGQLGSCTGFAVEALREFIILKNNIKLTTLSPLFIYYEERALEGATQKDAGATIRSGMKVLASKGVCPEIDWPYAITKFKKAPTKTAIKHATKYKVLVYSRLNVVISDFKSVLAQGHGIVLGFNVYSSFVSDVVASTGLMPMPKQGEQLLGGHAVFVCGYTDDGAWPGGGYLIIKNSWGRNWGDLGFFYMPYAYLINAYVGDVWTASN